MDIAKFSIEKKVTTWMTIIVFSFVGLASFFQLGRLEDPEFTIKTAMVYTSYPGASPKEVEDEVTDKIETAVQKLQYVDKITSRSYPGQSEVTVDIKDQYRKDDLAQIWDELRRKITDVQAELPPGVRTSVVNDDFGDVFGIYYALTGDGYSYRELYEYAKLLRKELLLINNVSKIEIAGDVSEQIIVEISQAKLAELGIAPKSINNLLTSQNLVAPSGEVRVGDEKIRIEVSGELDTIETIANLIITQTKSDKLIYLKDIAKVYRDYDDLPRHFIHYNGKPALSLGISIASGGNIVDLGHAINKRLNELSKITPAGLQIHKIYDQPDYVDKSVKNFVNSLLQAIAIVIIVLLFSMGIRSGFIIGSILLLSIFGTFVFMGLFSIDLQRISLGALIIALGMLVDNAIVVAEGVLVKIQQGKDAKKSASQIVEQTKWPLLGATIVGILAFAPIGLSDDSTGEFCGSLFYVILISLLLSWYFAITATPLFCVSFLKAPEKTDEQKDEYGGPIYQAYLKLLKLCLKARWATVIVMLGLLVVSGYGFTHVKQSFFPDSMTPIFYVDYWRAEGTDIRATKEDIEKIEKYVTQLENVASVTSFIGHGAARFTLTYNVEQPNTSYAQLFIQTKSFEDIKTISKQVLDFIARDFSHSEGKSIFMALGPGGGSKIEARFLGSDPIILRQLSNQAQAIMRSQADAINIKDDWRQKVKVVQAEYSEKKGRRVGITRSTFKESLELNFSGTQAGLFRENDELLPIIVRPPEKERLNISSINNIKIWSNTANTTIPIQQVINGFNTEWQDQLIHRQNRKLVITTSCDPNKMNANDLFQILKPQIEAIKLPQGYSLEWGGEYEDSTNAQAALAKQLPKGIFFMIVIVILLFNALKQPAIIWLTVPFSIVGVTIGLLLTGESFGFMPLLGLLSLTGMLIKNAIVLIDQIDLEISSGKNPLSAVIDSSLSRMRPVVLAAATTVLGMIPLLPDVFFSGMAVTIMSGLTFATILTLVFVPVLYVIFFKIKYEEATQ